MYINVNEILAPYYDVINKETGKRIGMCQWADDKTGQYEIFIQDENGELIFDETNQRSLTEIKKGKIKIVRKATYIGMFFDSIIRLYKEIIRRRNDEKSIRIRSL